MCRSLEYHSRNSCEVTALVLLDLSSAFDTVDHATLLQVLEKWFFVEGSALIRFQSYLYDHSQVFCANEKSSKAIQVNCSVPHGSVLRPVEFISYTRDITEIFKHHHVGYHLFAVNKQCYKSVAPSEVDPACDCLRVVADVHQW